MSAPTITDLETRISEFVDGTLQTLDDFWNEQNKKFDMVFQILTELREQQRALEESIGHLHAAGQNEDTHEVRTCEDVLLALGVVEEDLPFIKEAGETPETQTPQTGSPRSNSDSAASLPSLVQPEIASALCEVKKSYRDVVKGKDDPKISADHGSNVISDGSVDCKECESNAEADLETSKNDSIRQGQGDQKGSKSHWKSWKRQQKRGNFSSGKFCPRQQITSCGNQEATPDNFEEDFSACPESAFHTSTSSGPQSIFRNSASSGLAIFEKDCNCIKRLCAPEETYQRLLCTARRVPEFLLDDGGDASTAVASIVSLYGSLSLQQPEHLAAMQDWPSYFVNKYSDVDLVVQVNQGFTAGDVVQKLLTNKEGSWRLIKEMRVTKFATTHFTFLGHLFSQDGCSKEIYLDISCIMSPVHFYRFSERQAAFVKSFFQTRCLWENQFALEGALAFDTYIHLLKRFAANLPRHVLTGFQATCIGLFTLQIGYFKRRPNQSFAFSLFEGFLTFCVNFFHDLPVSPDTCNYRHWAMDISTGKWMPHTEIGWQCELYFMEVEMAMNICPKDRLNVTHSLDPACVYAEAQSMLARFFPC